MNVLRAKPTTSSVSRRFDGGFLEVHGSPLGDLPVLHVAGTPEGMGRQYGALVGDMILRNYARTMDIFSQTGLPLEAVNRMLDNAWARLAPLTPERYLTEMKGITEGARNAGYDIPETVLHRIVTVTNFDLYKREQRIFEFLDEDARHLLGVNGGPGTISCTMFAVWGSRSIDGKLFASRNLDWVCMTGIHENRLLTVYRPEGKRAFVSIGFAGIPGILAGMNEEGVALSEIGAFSVREELNGVPWVLMARQVLEDSGSLEDAVAIIKKVKHTIGYNYQIADGDPDHFGTSQFRPRAAVFETNHECCEVFFENDSQEHAAAWIDPQGVKQPYGLPLREAVLRSDTAFGARTRALQATDNGPGEPENDGNPFKEFLGNTYLECYKPMHDMIRAYETGAEYVFPLRVTKVIEAGKPRRIGPEEALTIAATVAHNVEKAHIRDWNIMSVVYAPTDLDFWVAYESCDADGMWKNAPDSGYLEFNLKQLL